jgi:hypothetical protein
MRWLVFLWCGAIAINRCGETAPLKKHRAIPEFAYMPVFAVIAKTIYD